MSSTEENICVPYVRMTAYPIITEENVVWYLARFTHTATVNPCEHAAGSEGHSDKLDFAPANMDGNRSKTLCTIDKIFR